MINYIKIKNGSISLRNAQTSNNNIKQQHMQQDTLVRVLTHYRSEQDNMPAFEVVHKVEVARY
jgi:hypothetical protein